MKIKTLLFNLFFLVLAFSLNAQNISALPELDSIKILFSKISESRTDNNKNILNDSLISCFRDIFADEKSFDLSFDSVMYLTTLRSDDNLLKVYTWNINYKDGCYKYFGFLQYKTKNGIEIFFLDDKKYNEGENIKNRHYKSPSEWYGAIYYEIVTKKWNGQTFYTLIGWDGADLFINRKIIDVLYFDRTSLPVFGKKMFKDGKNTVGRMIFEYNETAVMMLRYNSKHDIIVLDHLSPSMPMYKGLPEYYGPDKSFDALRFKQGRWVLETNIDPDIAINYKKNQNVNIIKRNKKIKNKLK